MCRRPLNARSLDRMERRRTTRPLVISCAVIAGLMFVAATRAATSLPLAIGAWAMALLGPLLLPSARLSWTPENARFVVFSVAAAALSGVAYVLRPNAITVVLAVVGFLAWCLCGFAVVTAGY